MRRDLCGMRPTSRRGVAVVLTSTASRTCCLDILAPPMGLTSPSDVVIALLPTNSSGIRASASTKARVSRPAAISTFLLGRIKSGSFGVGAEGPQGRSDRYIRFSENRSCGVSVATGEFTGAARLRVPGSGRGHPATVVCGLCSGRSLGKMERGDLSASRHARRDVMTPFHVSMFLGDWGPYETQKHKNRGLKTKKTFLSRRSEGTTSYPRRIKQPNYVTESMIVWRCVWLFLSTP